MYSNGGVQNGPDPESPRFESYRYVENIQKSSSPEPQMFEIWFVALPGGLLVAI